MDRNIFIAPQQNELFNKQGYIHLSLFSADEIATLKKLSAEHNFRTSGGYTKSLNNMEISLFDQRTAERVNFFNEVWDFIAGKVEAILSSYEPVMINFWSKNPGGGSLELHQNWTHVDEDKYTSLSLWIPLQATNKTNGTMELVPGSQDKIKGVRGPGITHAFNDIEEHIRNKFLQTLNFNLGETVFINDSILHYTGHNSDTKSRDAIQVLLKPKQAEALFYVGNGQATGNVVKRYEVEKEFFPNLIVQNVTRETPAHARLTDTFTADFKQLSIEEFERLMVDKNS